MLDSGAEEDMPCCGCAGTKANLRARGLIMSISSEAAVGLAGVRGVSESEKSVEAEEKPGEVMGSLWLRE